MCGGDCSALQRVCRICGQVQQFEPGVDLARRNAEVLGELADGVFDLIVLLLQKFFEPSGLIQRVDIFSLAVLGELDQQDLGAGEIPHDAAETFHAAHQGSGVASVAEDDAVVAPDREVVQRVRDLFEAYRLNDDRLLEPDRSN